MSHFFRGSALALDVACIYIGVVTVVYTLCSKEHKQAWGGEPLYNKEFVLFAQYFIFILTSGNIASRPYQYTDPKPYLFKKKIFLYRHSSAIMSWPSTRVLFSNHLGTFRAGGLPTSNLNAEVGTRTASEAISTSGPNALTTSATQGPPTLGLLILGGGGGGYRLKYQSHF